MIFDDIPHYYDTRGAAPQCGDGVMLSPLPHDGSRYHSPENGKLASIREITFSDSAHIDMFDTPILFTSGCRLPLSVTASLLGIDLFKAEYFKYGMDVTCQEIANDLMI